MFADRIKFKVMSAPGQPAISNGSPSFQSIPFMTVIRPRATYEHYRFPSFDLVNLLVSSDTLPPNRSDAALFFNGPHGIALRYNRDRPPFVPHPRGGYTVCIIKQPNKPSVMGFAYCSREDNFCYERGRAIAFGRAEKLLQTLKPIR